jgi:hypothetical protein
VTAPTPRPWQLGLIAATPLVVWLLAVTNLLVALPVVAAALVAPAFLAYVGAERHGAAWSAAMAWAALFSASVITLVWVSPELLPRILYAEPYRQEMFGWIATGVGKENDPRRWLPEHALHLAGFLVLARFTAGLGGLVLGAGLVAYMSAFVGAYAAAAGQPLLGAVVAWVPWSVVRVAAFVALGVACAAPAFTGRGWRFDARERRLFALGFAGIATDVLLKATLAPAYGRFLLDFAGGRLTSP